MTTTHRTIESKTVLQPRQAARGFVEATVFHGGPVVLDPFLALTDFHMTLPTFAPHPHAGFSAVTYMFRDGVGSFRNRDTSATRASSSRAPCTGRRRARG